MRSTQQQIENACAKAGAHEVYKTCARVMAGSQEPEIFETLGLAIPETMGDVNHVMLGAYAHMTEAEKQKDLAELRRYGLC